VLSESEESFSRKYRLKSRGFNFEKVVERVLRYSIWKRIT